MKSIYAVISLLVALSLAGCAATNKMFHPGAAKNIDGSIPAYDSSSTSVALLSDRKTIQSWSDVMEARARLSKSPKQADFLASQKTEWIDRYTDFSGLDSFKRAELETAYRDAMANVMLEQALALDDTLFAVRGNIRFGEYDLGKKAYPIVGLSIDNGINSAFDPVSKRLTLSGGFNRKKSTIALNGSILSHVRVSDTERAKKLKADWYRESQPFVIISEFVDVANFGEPQIFFNGLCKVIKAPNYGANLVLKINKDRSTDANLDEACTLANRLLNGQVNVAHPNLNFSRNDL